jgi:hypothetical protein
MTAGQLVDVYIDCNKCGLRFLGSDADLLEGMTLRQVRSAAQARGWQTGVQRQDGSPRAGLPNSLLDYCPKDRTDKAT